MGFSKNIVKPKRKFCQESLKHDNVNANGPTQIFKLEMQAEIAQPKFLKLESPVQIAQSKL